MSKKEFCTKVVVVMTFFLIVILAFFKICLVFEPMTKISNEGSGVIGISSAKHLDAEKNFVLDVYDYVLKKDNNWVSVPSGNYLRISFEKNLTNLNDITIYSRGDGKVIIYGENSEAEVARFDNVSYGLHKVYLNNLVGIEDTFDFFIIGDVDFDWITDPETGITDCRLLNESGTIYNLGNDINAVGTCFNITSDNVTLNCGGYSIIGNTTGYGIVASNIINISIEGCKLYNFSTAIKLENTDYSSVNNITLADNYFSGTEGVLTISKADYLNMTNSNISSNIMNYNIIFLNNMTKSKFENLTITNNNIYYGSASVLLIQDVENTSFTNFDLFNNSVNLTRSLVGSGFVSLYSESLSTTTELNNFSGFNFISNNLSSSVVIIGGGLIGLYGDAARYNYFKDLIFEDNFVNLTAQIQGGGLIGLYSYTDNNRFENLTLIANLLITANDILGGGLIGLYSFARYDNFSFVHFERNAIYVNKSISGGGLVGGYRADYHNFSYLTIRDNLMEENDSISGGGLIGFEGYGFNNYYLVNVLHTNLSSNNVSARTSIYGGGLIGFDLLYQQGNYSNITLDSNKVYSNLSSAETFGFYNGPNSNSVDNLIIKNNLGFVNDSVGQPCVFGTYGASSNRYSNILIEENNLTQEANAPISTTGFYQNSNSNNISNLSVISNKLLGNLNTGSGMTVFYSVNNNFYNVSLINSSGFTGLTLASLVAYNRFNKIYIESPEDFAVKLIFYNHSVGSPYDNYGYPIANFFTDISMYNYSSGSLQLIDNTNESLYEDSFPGYSTIFSNFFENVTLPNQVWFENHYGTLNYSGNINFTSQILLTNIVNLSQGTIKINTTDVPTMNQTAVITLKNFSYTNSIPYVALDDINFLECTSETNPSCTNISNSEYNLTFIAEHFTTYEGRQDLTPPKVEIVSPTATTYSSYSVSFEVRTDENSSCNYSLDSGATNYTMTANSSGTGHTASASLSNSNYVANFYCEDIHGNFNSTQNISFTVSVSSSGTPDTGGSTGISATPSSGGGGGGGTPSRNWAVNESLIQRTILFESNSSGVIKITNNERYAGLFKVKVTSLEEIIKFNESEVNIDSKSSQDLVFTIVSPNKTGVYLGKIIVYSGTDSREINVIIDVETETSLFDVLLEIPENKQRLGLTENLEAKVTLVHLGLEQEMNATLEYLISDFEGNTFLIENEALSKVYANQSIYKVFNTSYFGIGSYVLSVELVYPNGVAVASRSFVVEERLIETSSIVVILILFLIGLILIFLQIRNAGGFKYVVQKYVLRKEELNELPRLGKAEAKFRKL